MLIQHPEYKFRVTMVKHHQRLKCDVCGYIVDDYHKLITKHKHSALKQPVTPSKSEEKKPEPPKKENPRLEEPAGEVLKSKCESGQKYCLFCDKPITSMDDLAKNHKHGAMSAVAIQYNTDGKPGPNLEDVPEKKEPVKPEAERIVAMAADIINKIKPLASERCTKDIYMEAFKEGVKFGLGLNEIFHIRTL